MSQTATESRGGEQIPNIPAQPFQFASCLVSLQGCLQNWAGWTKFSFTQTQFNLYLRPRPVRREECWFRRLLCCSAPCSRWMTGIHIYTDVKEWRVLIFLILKFAQERKWNPCWLINDIQNNFSVFQENPVPFFKQSHQGFHIFTFPQCGTNKGLSCLILVSD